MGRRIRAAIVGADADPGDLRPQRSRLSGRRSPTSRTVLTACLAALLLPTCVSMHRGNVYPDDRDEVFVSYFVNETFYRDVEFDVTEQVVNEILSSPGLHLSSKADAEILLTGRVLDVRQRVLSSDPQQTPTAENTSITVEVIVKDARTGEVLRKQKLSQQGQFVTAFGQTLETAQREAYLFLARDIVRLLEEGF